MALTDDEKQTLEALQKKASEPEPDAFDIEIWDETGAGAKVPYSKGRQWLARFGIDVEPPKPEDVKDDKTDDKSREPHATRYFGPKSTKAS